MILSRIELLNFRNYRRQEGEFSPGLNLIVGRNAQGKSNLLEAVYLLSHLKSNRAPRARDLVLDGETQASVSGVILEDEGRTTLRVGIGGDGRRVLVNGQMIEPLARAKGILKCVLFTPDDLYLVKGEPSRRRDFLDETTEGLGAAPAGELSEYRHLLRQRNAILKRWEEYGGRLKEALDPWTEGLVMLGGRIVAERLSTIKDMSAFTLKGYPEISGDSKEATLRYVGSFEIEGHSPTDLSLAMRETLERRFGEEKKTRSTVAGPHRDNVVVSLGGRDTRHSASQGEQRTLAFCLRIAQREYLEAKTGKVPILMLDDVLSELDEHRRRRILELSAEGSQVFITATEAPREWTVKDTSVTRVEGGTLIID